MAMDDKAKLAYWSEHYRAWQASSLTRRAYCEREKLSLKSYERWTRRARATASTAAPTSTPNRPLTLVPVSVTSQPRSDMFMLRSPGGWEMRLPAGIDATWLAALMTSLG
jgi:hypothetical protein